MKKGRLKRCNATTDRAATTYCGVPVGEEIPDFVGQERTEGDRRGVLLPLQTGGYRERSVYEMTDAFYKTVGK
jgi:hypothetical protein